MLAASSIPRYSAAFCNWSAKLHQYRIINSRTAISVDVLNSPALFVTTERGSSPTVREGA